ncbi:hypothetical protein EZS27_030221 [termite gut metagenome]|uniref:DUF4870 domain-containing protein n=1 Tax=termite gut metagenome TaxID=433724 RepID=A0A5J4QGL3_9ZZZZ
MEETNNNNEQKTVCGLNENVYVGLMNLALVITQIGWIVSIVLWGVGRDKSELVKEQGKNVLNWVISWVIYSLILLFFGIGKIFTSLFSGMHGNYFGFGSLASYFENFSIFALTATAISIFLVVCPIIGALKGFDGQTWRYPLAIRFLK